MESWFGPKAWPSDACRTEPRAAIPVGLPCQWCEEPIGPQDRGFLSPFMAASFTVTNAPIHLECRIRMVVGCVACINAGHHHPADASHQDAPGLTRHQAARAAMLAFSRHREEQHP